MSKKPTEKSEPPATDVEVKVKQMLDPSLPDASSPKIQAISTPAADTIPSAPELPSEQTSEPSKTPQPDPPSNIVIASHGEPNSIAKELDESIAKLGPNPDEKPVAPNSDEIEAPIISDPATEKAVDEITAEESDMILEVEDAMRDNGEPVKTVKKPHQNIAELLKNWWAIPKVRKGIIIGAVLLVLGLALYPDTRYFALNTVGVRASSSITIVDNSSQQPLKNVQVKIGNVSGVSDVNGKVRLSRVRLGNNKLVIEKRGFATATKDVTLGWGSNPLGELGLTPTGSQYSFVVTDFLSGKPVSKVEASSNEASALSDEKGIIKLTVDGSEDAKITVSIKGESYRTEQLEFDANDKSMRQVKLVPAKKHVFVSKRSGKYDIYSIYVDGKDEKLVLAGSGNEREDMVIAPHPSSDTVAYVSTRAGQRNKDKYLLSNLLLINTSDNTTTNVLASERLEIVGWSENYLIYLVVAEGSSASNPKRHRLMSYNLTDGVNKELAASNYFNSTYLAYNTIYYAPSSAGQTGQINFYKISPNGTGNQSLLNQEVWSVFRSAYDHITLATEKNWYDLPQGGSVTKLNSPPSNQVPRVYIDSPDGKHSLWVDIRDGKGVLISYDTTTKKDTTLHSQSGLGYPTSWLGNNTVVYRVRTDQETADYAVSINGGKPVKIRDVTNSSGL